MGDGLVCSQWVRRAGRTGLIGTLPAEVAPPGGDGVAMVGVAHRVLLEPKPPRIEAGDESGSWLPGSAWLARPCSRRGAGLAPARDAPGAAAAVDSAGMVAATAVDSAGCRRDGCGVGSRACRARWPGRARLVLDLRPRRQMHRRRPGGSPSCRRGASGRPAGDSADGSVVSVLWGGTAATGAAGLLRRIAGRRPWQPTRLVIRRRCVTSLAWPPLLTATPGFGGLRVSGGWSTWLRGRLRHWPTCARSQDRRRSRSAKLLRAMSPSAARPEQAPWSRARAGPRGAYAEALAGRGRQRCRGWPGSSY